MFYGDDKLILCDDLRINIGNGRKSHGMYPESPLDRIPTGRNPHWTKSPPEFHEVMIPFLGARNPHWTESPQLESHCVY